MKLKSLFAGAALLLALSLTGCSGSVEKGLEYLEAGEFESAAEEFQARKTKMPQRRSADWESRNGSWKIMKAPAMRSSLRWTTAPKRREHFIILSAAATFASAIRLRL